MKRNLVLADGVRLAERDEIPGPDADRDESWARIQAAAIAPGYVLRHVQGERFKFYAEANVDAPAIWPVFCDLCLILFDADATLLFGQADDELAAVGSADVSTIIEKLEPHQYQLVHDGFLQFGVLSDRLDAIAEVLVAPTKHFCIWLNDEVRFRLLMEKHGLPEDSALEFLDQFPRVTTILSQKRTQDVDLLAKMLMAEIAE